MQKAKDSISGGYYFWNWNDNEIISPRNLRPQIELLLKQGFSGIFTNIGNTRYSIDNPVTLRAISQVSQWACRRHLEFFLQIDPRQYSRPLIYKTGERTKNILLTRKPHLSVERKNLNITPVQDNSYHIRIHYPDKIPDSLMQDKALSFEPHCLEKVFLFKLIKGKIVKDTINDITDTACFSADIINNWVEIFGRVGVPSLKDWYVAVFPKFNTNLYDFAGRDSNDILLEFIEELFDAFININGIIWGRRDFGYISGLNRIPVSLSIYNSFKAEYGYDLADFLLSLILEMDDKSHIKVRLDYYNLLMELIYDGVQEFHSMLNSFFHGVDISSYFSPHTQNHINGGNVDPWRSLDRATIIFSESSKIEKRKVKADLFLTSLVMVKSLSVHSKKKKVYHKIDLSTIFPEQLSFWIDLMSLYSIEYLIENKDIILESPNKLPYKQFNKKINTIRNLTGFVAPESDYAFIFPVETVITSDLSQSEKIIDRVYKLIAKLILAGIQIDVLSPVLLKKGKISDNSLNIGNRFYKGVIYPFPDIIDGQVFDLLKALEKTGCPVLSGGKPHLTRESQQIETGFKIWFDPWSNDLSCLDKNGIKPLGEFPKNCIGSLIKNKKKKYILLNPARYGKTIKGQVTYKDYTFTVPEKTSLVIYELSGKGKVTRVLG